MNSLLCLLCFFAATRFYSSAGTEVALCMVGQCGGAHGSIVGGERRYAGCRLRLQTIPLIFVRASDRSGNVGLRWRSDWAQLSEGRMGTSSSQPDVLDLNNLRLGMPGIEPARGASFAHAASVCLEERHRSGVLMLVDGDFSGSFALSWDPIDDQIRRSWADLEDATEKGAYGIAALLVVQLTDFTVVARARKGRGFDYWLGPKNAEPFLFQNTSRLEVSGIRDGDEYELNRRVRMKIVQVKPDSRKLPSFVVVVEFGRPRTRMVKK